MEKSLDILRTTIDDVFAMSHELIAGFDDAFIDDDIERVQKITFDIDKAYVEERYADAFHQTESLIDLIEKLELAYTRWQTDRNEDELFDGTGDTLDILQEDPDKVEKGRHLSLVALKAQLATLGLEFTGTFHDRAYPVLDRLELVILLFIIQRMALPLFGVGEWNSTYLGIGALLSLVAIAIFVLRLTRYVIFVVSLVMVLVIAGAYGLLTWLV